MAEQETQTAKRIPMGAYVDREQHQRLAALAERNERSLSAEVRLALREHIEREAEEATA
jgi:predicted transcriptional regulator